MIRRAFRALKLRGNQTCYGRPMMLPSSERNMFVKKARRAPSTAML